MRTRYPVAEIFRAALFSLLSLQQASAWGSSNGDNDASKYGNALNRDWLYNSKSISLQLEGCMWGYVEDNEDSGCMEDESEDGTTYWYQMANCRRAQAVYSMYASDSSSTGCNSGNFKESVSVFAVNFRHCWRLELQPTGKQCLCISRKTACSQTASSLIFISSLQQMDSPSSSTTCHNTIPTTRSETIMLVMTMPMTTTPMTAVITTTMAVLRICQLANKGTMDTLVWVVPMTEPSRCSISKTLIAFNRQVKPMIGSTSLTAP